MSYPKYLIEIEENRFLDKDETVHHIDGNVENNDLENLVILDRSKHAKLDSKRIIPKIVNCVWCGKEIVLDGANNRQKNRRETGFFCSRQCTGSYGSAIREKRTEKIFSPKLEMEYYREKYKSNE
jgi:hypothetical protein